MEGIDVAAMRVDEFVRQFPAQSRAFIIGQIEIAEIQRQMNADVASPVLTGHFDPSKLNAVRLAELMRLYAESPRMAAEPGQWRSRVWIDAAQNVLDALRQEKVIW